MNMTKYNYSKLLGKMRERGLTQETLALQCGVELSTLNRKLRGRGEWKQGEIIKACDAVGIDYADIPVYFFAQ